MLQSIIVSAASGAAEEHNPLAPEWIEVLTDLVAKARPQAEIELVENLGAVVGTHAGPGAVGFFWLQDEA